MRGDTDLLFKNLVLFMFELYYYYIVKDDKNIIK
jgi:hypothetical protein